MPRVAFIFGIAQRQRKTLTMQSPLRDHHEPATAVYEADYALWLQDTRNKLAQRDFAAIDVTHLLEEIDDLSRREKRKLKQLLRQLLVSPPQARVLDGRSLAQWQPLAR